MTDNDDPAPPRDVHLPLDLNGAASRAGSRPHGKTSQQPTRSGARATQVDPTDPEVPSAKRRGALRRQRSLVGLAGVVVGLLSITLSLLYRASRGVGAPHENAGDRPLVGGARSDNASPPHDLAHESTMTGLRPPPTPSGSELDDEAPADDDASSDSAPTGSSAPPVKIPPPAPDIIRTPPF